MIILTIVSCIVCFSLGFYALHPYAERCTIKKNDLILVIKDLIEDKEQSFRKE